MTQRSRLDAFLAERAANAGADFRDGAKVTDLELTETGVRGTRERRKSSCKGGTLRGRRRTASAPAPPGSTTGATTASRSRQTSPTASSLARAVPGPPLPRARERARRLRLGLPEGRPRQRRRRRLGARGAADAGASCAVLPRVLDPRVGLETCAATGCRFSSARARLRAGAARPARRRGRARRPALRRRDVRGVRSRRKLAAGETLDAARGRQGRIWRATTESCGGALVPLAAAWGAKLALDRFPRLTYAPFARRYVWRAVVSLTRRRGIPARARGAGLRRARSA